MAEGHPDDRELAILRYVRDHGEASAAAIARDVLQAPLTTFGRPVRLAEVETELADLVAQDLLARTGSGRRAVFTFTAAGRERLRTITPQRPM